MVCSCSVYGNNLEGKRQILARHGMICIKDHFLVGNGMDHDLKLSRFAGSNHVLVAGCLEESDGSKTVWRIEVDKPSGEASCQSDAGEVFRVISGSGRRSELIAVHGLLTVMRERALRNK